MPAKISGTRPVLSPYPASDAQPVVQGDVVTAERPESLDRLSVLRNQVFMLDDRCMPRASLTRIVVSGPRWGPTGDDARS